MVNNPSLMDQEKWNDSTLRQALAGLPLGGMRYFPRLDSTNAEAARWLEEGAPHFALVIANEQTAGRGRHGRSWFTPPGAALAFSLVFRPGEWYTPAPDPLPSLARLSALGAVAVCHTLVQEYGLVPQIKWPNDVLLQRRKVCGVLAEGRWQGEQLQAAILGIGINVTPAALPPPTGLLYPATCVQEAFGRPLSRLRLLRQVLERIVYWQGRLDTPDFHTFWEEHLAFKGELIALYYGSSLDDPPALEGLLLGLDERGCLRLRLADGQERRVCEGELRLRPLHKR